MSLTSTMKRPRPALKSTATSKKRQRLTQKPPSATKPFRKIHLNDLGWKTVALPDRLDDFEGFYGLEEIDDVAIVRDTATGLVSFETSKTEEQVQREVEEAWRAREEEGRALERVVFGRVGSDGEDEEVGEEEEEGEKEEERAGEDEVDWEGFSDEEALSDGGLGEKACTQTTSATNGHSNAAEDKIGIEEAPKARMSERKEEQRRNGSTKMTAAKTGGAEGTEMGDHEPNRFELLANRSDDEDVEVDVTAWEKLGLSQEILESLASLNFSAPTSIQASTIPEIMAGRDVIGKASTGSGKTLAFGVPIVEAFLASRSEGETAGDKTLLALIIAPTRELAHQITGHLEALCSKGDFTSPRIASITGGLSVQKQRRLLEKADIVVGTPGRLWEVISSGQGLLHRFKQVQFLVIDEADRLLSEGHYKEFREILKILDRDDEVEDGENGNDAAPSQEVERQTLVFSATFQKDLQHKLAGKIKKSGDLMNKQQSMEYLLTKLKFREERPKFIDANPTSQMASNLKEGLVECAGTEKDLYLYSLLMFYPNKRALIFTNSISAVRRLTPFLANLALPALPLHSNMPQKARLRSIERFAANPGSILVATDVAARGLDIPQVELVLHYHLPRAADTYVHRSGRTARADASGSSILLCAPEEVAGVRRLVAKVHARATDAPRAKGTAHYIRTLDVDRRIVSRLKPRATLAKKLADTAQAKEKKNAADDVLRAAAEDLGVDFDDEEFEHEAKGKRGRGAGRKKKEREAREMSKAEIGAMRAELKGLLRERVNVGVSVRYLTSGGVDVEKLMRGEGNLGFLGEVGGLGLDD